MTIYSVQGPDGRVYDIEGPEGASDRDVIAALQQHLSAAAPAPKAKPKTGFMPALKSGKERLVGDIYAGLAGLGVEGAEAKARAQQEKAAAMYQQPEFLEHPVDYVTGLLGQSLPYMAAPLVAGAAATPLGPLAAMGAAGAASATQFTGSNLARQLAEGRTGEQLEVGKAAAAALPQAALDVIGFRYVPGIRTLFSKAGVPITEEAAKGIAGRYILPAAKTAGVEGATEAGQQVFERLQAGLSLTDAEAKKEYFESFLGGAVLGGTLAIPGTMLEGRRRPEEVVAPEAAAATEVAPVRERGEITTIPPTERGEIGVAKYRPPEAASEAVPEIAPEAPAPTTPQPNVIDLMDQYATAQPRMEALQEQIREAAVAGDTAKAKDLFAQLKTQRESLGGLKTQIEELGGVAQTADEFAKSSAQAMGALDKKIKTAQKALSNAGELGEFDNVPKLADKLDKLQAERDALQATQARHNELLRIQGTPKGETIPLFAADKAQPKSTKVLEAGAGPLPPTEEEKAKTKVDEEAVAAKEAEAERKAGELVELVKAGPKPATAEDKAKILAELNTAREKYQELQAVRVQSDQLEENKASMRRRITDLENQLASTTKSATQEGHIDFVNKESEKLNKLYDEIDALRGGKPAPTESPLALFQRDNLLRTAIVNGDKKAIDLFKRAQKEAEQRGQRGLPEQEKLVQKMEQRFDLPGTIVERAVDDEEYDSIMDKVETQLRKINNKQGNAKESYIQKAERLWKEMETFKAASTNKEATPHQRAMARRTYNAKLKEYETILNGQITPAREEIYRLYNQLYTKKEVGKASEIAAEKTKETERAGREEREVSTEVKRAKKLEEGKGIKAAPARVARDIGYDTEEYQKLATTAQKKIDAKVAQYNAFVNKAKQQLEKLKGKKGDPEKAEVMRKEMEAAKAVSENNLDDAVLRRKYNTKKEQYEAFITGSTVSAAYKTKEAAVVKAANEKLNALNEFKQNIANALDAKAEELGRAAPEMRSALLEATKERKKAAAQSTQEVKSKRTVQETRKVAKLGTMSTGTPESQARSAAKQAVFEEKTIKPEKQARVEKAIKEVNKAPSKVQGTQMEAAMTKAAQKKAEEGKFARGVEIESPDLTAAQIKHLENNDVVSALRSIVNDKSASDINRAVAQRLAVMLDNTGVELHNRLYDNKGKEVLGEAISTRIKLSRAGGLSQEVLLHEGTHAAVERVIQMPDSMLTKEQIIAKRELTAMYNSIKNDPSITSSNAKSSLSEFAAEVFSNKNLQEQLRKKKWKGSSLWEGLKSVILRMLGVKIPETMLGSALKSVDLLMIPSSEKIGRVETPVNRQYSAKDIAALETGSNSMRVFAEQFGPEIKQKDRTAEDVERLASKYLTEFENDPEKFVAQANPDKLDYEASATMSDGKVYDPENLLHFVEAEPLQVVSADALKNPLYAKKEAEEINKERNNALLELTIYLTANPSYTVAEQALVAKAASKYGVIAGRDGRLKVVNISDNNRHPVAVVGHESANAVIEELRKGKSLKDAFLDGLQANADRNAKENKGKNGWQKFNQSKTEEAAVELNAAAAGTPWCTGAGLSYARNQIAGGDFYIYYANGKPEVAVRMTGQDKIQEVRGNSPNQGFNTEQRVIAKQFLQTKKFKKAEDFIQETERKEALISLASGKRDLTVLEIMRLAGDSNIEDEHGISAYALKTMLRFRATMGYSAPSPSDNVQEQLKALLTEQIENKYANGYWLYESPYIGWRDTPDSIVKATVLGREYSLPYNQIKALDRFVLNPKDKGLFSSLEYANKLIAYGGEHTLPKIKDIKEINSNGAEGEITTLTLPDGATIGEISSSFSKKTALNINGKVKINSVQTVSGPATVDLNTPDAEYVIVNSPSLSELGTDIAENYAAIVRKKLRESKIETGVMHDTAYSTGSAIVPAADAGAARIVETMYSRLGKIFGKDKVNKAVNDFPADAAASDALVEIVSGLIRDLQSKDKLFALGNKQFDAIKDFTANEMPNNPFPTREGKVVAPNIIYSGEETFTHEQERPRYAPKDVGVQEDKPGVFSFKSARQEASIAPSFVTKDIGIIDKLKANFLGLAGRVQFVDQLAALSEALKKGVDSKKLEALEAEQAEYYLRFSQNRSQYAGQFLTNGPVSLVKQETKRGKEFTYSSKPGANMMQVADAIAPSKIGNDTEKEAILTALLAGERAKQVGWAKLNFENPAKVEQEYNQVKALLDSRPQDKAMFDNAMKIYKEYNNGLIDFLVQTGTMTKEKAAELKSYTYVPFYRVNKGTGEIELMVDKERPVRIGNIKDEPQLQALVGDSTEILPIFTSSVQNTFMLTEMALRNQMVKENAFMLNKIGIASTIGLGAGPAGPDTVRFKHKGEDHFVVIDTDLYGIPASLIVKGMEGIKTTIPAAVRMLGMPADILRKFVTRNPAYAIKQAIRDPLTAWMTTGVDGVPVLNGMKELVSMVAGRSDAEKKLMESGAISSNIFTGDKADMDKFLKEISMGRSGWQKLMARADAFALQGDAATRAVIYRDSLNKGMSEMQAMLRTLESMNFGRRGLSPSMQMASVLIPFFNAQIQGLDVLYRAFKGDMPYSQQLEIRKKMLARGVMLAAGTIAYAAMMEDDEAYKNAKPEERLGNWFLPTPFSDEPLRIPVPFELGYLFKSLPEAVYNMAAEDERNNDITKGMRKLVFLSNPFSLPQAVKPATEVYLGKSFFGGDIESQREIHGMVPTERYRTGTTEISKMIGSITGDIGLSPIKLDYLIRGYTGGLGIALVSIANPILNTETTEKPTTKTSKLPFIGGLFQPVEGRGTLDAAYERMLEVQQAKGTYNALMQQGKRDEAAEFREEYIDKISSASVSGTVQQKLGELAKIKRQVEASPTLSTERKDELIKRLENQQNLIAKRFLQISDRTTRQAAQP